ncbi:hypothetical protein C6Y62_12995 [Hyphomicrobium sulfonivorans]|nr:hypothetical protein [Hyphomicrobium sulfonivorans]
MLRPDKEQGHPFPLTKRQANELYCFFANRLPFGKSAAFPGEFPYQFHMQTWPITKAKCL